ncbi:hypothetical protein [Streptomyces inhibens]|uniref:hypothetical protein n=1 Tax=Streptomyces inhibens TaxID=2293571 RepID=UPI001EE6A2FA|nr:hypothetical protein [Streptomyces inhibens]UKY47798.1 hypothetical protein KI385_02395 [Streptomyces inhibens]
MNFPIIELLRGIGDRSMKYVPPSEFLDLAHSSRTSNATEPAPQYLVAPWSSYEWTIGDLATL